MLEKLFMKVMKVLIKIFQGSKGSLKIKNYTSFYFKKIFLWGGGGTLYQSYAIKLLNYCTVFGFSEDFLISFLKHFFFPDFFCNLNLSVMSFVNEKDRTLKYNWNSSCNKLCFIAL